VALEATLQPPCPRQLLQAAAEHSALAASIVNGFDEPCTFYPWWFDAERFVKHSAVAEHAALDTRALRNAFGHYATGVAVVTTRRRTGARSA
jgi:hypothetical protein